MTLQAHPREVVWLSELERRVRAGLPPNRREMLVALRNALPRGFRPSDVNYRLLNGDGLSVEGLIAIGDADKVIPDINRAICYIRDRLIETPTLEQINASEVSTALRMSMARAEQVLMLASSLGSFMASASGSTYGYNYITLGRDDIVAEYLAFENVEAALAKRVQIAKGSAVVLESAPFPDGGNSETLVRNTVFILMNMDPTDPALIDIHHTIQTVCEDFGLRALRIDDIEHQGRITDQILAQIASAEFIVADLSGERPNVYYEIGYAHAIGKHPILVRKTGTRLHFDLSVHNAPEYSNNTSLTQILRHRFEAILGRPSNTTHP